MCIKPCMHKYCYNYYEGIDPVKAKTTTAPLQQEGEEGEEPVNNTKGESVPHPPEQLSTCSSSLTSSTASITKLSQFDNKVREGHIEF